MRAPTGSRGLTVCLRLQPPPPDSVYRPTRHPPPLVALPHKQGIKVVDSDTKKKVLKVLKKRAESKMQVDGDKPQRQKKQRKAPAKAAAPTAAMDTSS